MRAPCSKTSRIFPLTFGIVAGLTFGQVALAGSESLSGQKVYSQVCIACHSPPGVGGAPALGDKAAWAPRIAQGKETLIQHALNGFSGKTGVMPKKGERADLSDEEVIGAVEYMIEQAAR